MKVKILSQNCHKTAKVKSRFFCDPTLGHSTSFFYSYMAELQFSNPDKNNHHRIAESHLSGNRPGLKLSLEVFL